MKKRIFTLLLACVLAAGTVAGPVGLETVQAGDTEEKEKITDDGLWKYEFEGDDTNSNIVLTKYLGTEANVEVPEWVPVGGVNKHVTSIDAFSRCSSLVSVKIPSSVTRIEWDAFSQCSSLVSVEIPSGVTSIGRTAFYGCSSLASIEIPSSVTSIGEDAFGECGKLEKITVAEGNPNYETDDGVLYNKGKTTLIRWPALTKEVISIPNSVTCIESGAFEECRSLVNIELPSSLTSIGGYAFRDCSSLVSMDIPFGVTTIEGNLFFGCSSLVSIGIPSSVTQIGYAAFNRQCTSLTDVYYGGSEEQWKAVRISMSDNGNNSLLSATIHYNSTMPEKPSQPGDTPQTPEQPQQPGTSDGGTSSQQPGTSEPTQTPQKSDQAITAKNITKTYGAKPFSLNVKVNTGTALTYAVSDKKVATIDKKGKVTIKGCGITNITITAPATDTYNQAKKTIKLTVKPQKVTLSSVKSTKKKTATVKWKKDKKASGYIIQCATDGKFKKNKVQVTVSKNKTVSATVKKLKAGKKYYVRVCAYAKSGKTKVQGDWSKVKTVKVKK